MLISENIESNVDITPTLEIRSSGRICFARIESIHSKITVVRGS